MNSRFNELRRFWFAGFFIFLAIPGLTFAQVPAAVEGPISVIVTDNMDGAYVTVMGITVHVPSSVFAVDVLTGTSSATSPTNKALSAADLIDATPLPGRFPLKGFEGGTAIINGMSSLTGGFVADDFFVEASETVLIGTVTAVDPVNVTGNNACDIYVEGVLLAFSDDYRMPFGESVNGSNFAVDPCTVVDGNSVAGEGYYGADDGAFHIFLFESDDATLLNANAEFTTITRASCRTGRSIEVRGSSTFISAGGTANVFDADTPIGEPATLLGSAALQVDALTGTSIYRIRENIGSCPQNIYVETHDSFGTLVSTSPAAPVDIR